MHRSLLLAIAAIALAACVTATPAFDPSKPHHTPEGFRNNYPHPEKESFWAWQWERLTGDRPRQPEGGWRFETVPPNPVRLRAPQENPSVTWVGHATLYLRVGGLHVLTDPHFSEYASPVQLAGPKRVVPPTPALETLPRIDAVLISHDHYDHLDRATVERLAAQPGGPPRFFVGLGTKAWFDALGIGNVIELDWWQRHVYRGVEFHFVPVQHWSKRTLWDTNQRLWGAWVLRHPELSFFFAGDTGYSPDFLDIGARFGGFDLAAIPIGSYAPRWFMKVMHVDPDEAVMIHRDVAARRSVAIHWGTFYALSDEDMNEPPQRLAQARKRFGLDADAFFTLRHGETRILSRH